ncbi:MULTISPECIES: hypothetical protein [unclassified Ectothiorhodospira]|uniref:hypothetical protein n=1 Tax=unclassified Ectothiorhodospira TaxID=2684909 RepID=UPI001EE8381C|nr:MULTISPECIES: hypothetical protein [unclassified Ectothiorhodospira]MCG5517094.1 hypothetical protein [Ectothiorhodospira sp. 9100]MCG5519756.1 hypothetical protein [Ectothiorhodospira sp. 9905]
MDPAPVLHDCLAGLTRGISVYTDAMGILQDPGTGDATPPDHYGQVAGALALYLREGVDPGWQKLLNAREAKPGRELGHAPFNRFLLLLFRRALEIRDPSSEALELVTREQSRCRLVRRYPSNNWTLLAGLCELLESNQSVKAAKIEASLIQSLDAWLTPEGGFVDFPYRESKNQRGATPIAYHHKALFIATVAAAVTGSPAWMDRVERMMRWALMCWDGHGHVGGLGRSNHALFGDACLVASLVMLGFSQGDRPQNPAQQMLQGILRRWCSQQRQDGLIGLNPSGDERAGWDGYMYLSVYNAWTAAVLSWGLHAAPSMEWTRERAFWRDEAPGNPLKHDPCAGICRCGNPTSAFMLINTEGQIPQAFANGAVELRYSGGLPFHLTWQGRLLCPPPVRLAVADLLACPARAGWTPVFQASDQMLYGLTDWVEEACVESDEIVEIRLTGIPRQLIRDPVEGLLGRVRAALDWRILDGRLGRSAVLKRSLLTGLEARLHIRFHKHRPQLDWEMALIPGETGNIRWLNPGAHALLSDTLPAQAHVVIRGEGLEERDADAASCWIEHPMDASLPGAIGRCLEPLLLQGGASHPLMLKGRLAWSL